MEADDAAPAPADDAPSEARMSALMSDVLFAGFETHVARLQAARKRRQEVLAFKSALEDPASTAENDGGVDQTQDELDGLGVRLPTDKWQGDVNMRTLQKLLARVDARGYERCVHPNPCRFRHALRALHRGPARSAQQLEFHTAFMKAAARVIYRDDWETQRPMIMEQYSWDVCKSEVLIRHAQKHPHYTRTCVH